MGTGSTRSPEEIEVQLAAILPVFDIDGDGEVGPLTDGLLALRYLFGFRGLTLINGAINTSGGTRDDSVSIEAYLDSIR